MAQDLSTAGEFYGQLITDQLAEERSRKGSLEARGIAVITTSGTLVTLLFGLTAGLTASTSFKLPDDSRLPLLLSLIAFVITAVLGLVTNLPLKYREPTARGLDRLVDEEVWTSEGVIGQLRVAGAQVHLIAAARAANNLKVKLLIWAIVSELVAVAFLCCSIVGILYG